MCTKAVSNQRVLYALRCQILYSGTLPLRCHVSDLGYITRVPALCCRLILVVFPSRDILALDVEPVQLVESFKCAGRTTHSLWIYSLLALTCSRQSIFLEWPCSVCTWLCMDQISILFLDWRCSVCVRLRAGPATSPGTLGMYLCGSPTQISIGTGFHCCLYSRVLSSGVRIECARCRSLVDLWPACSRVLVVLWPACFLLTNIYFSATYGYVAGEIIYMFYTAVCSWEMANVSTHPP